MKIWNKIKLNLRNKIWSFLNLDNVIAGIYMDHRKMLSALQSDILSYKKLVETLSRSNSLKLTNLEKRMKKYVDNAVNYLGNNVAGIARKEMEGDLNRIKKEFGSSKKSIDDIVIKHLDEWNINREKEKFILTERFKNEMKRKVDFINAIYDKFKTPRNEREALKIIEDATHGADEP